jgi:hypothetical protein
MGITMGTRMAVGLPYHITVYSDWMIAAIARGQEAPTPGLMAMGHPRNYPIMCDVLVHRSIKLIESQPENQMKQVEFGYTELGSYLADAAAGSNWEVICKIVSQGQTHTMILEDIMDSDRDMALERC